MSRILEYISKYDETLTIAQLKEAIELEQISAKQKETEEIGTVKKDFKDIYLKRIYDCDLFGETLQLFHILEITDTHKTTDYKTVYEYKGSKLSFERNGIAYQTIYGDDVYYSFSEEDLRQMTVITKEEYNKYNWHYNEISKKLDDLIRL